MLVPLADIDGLSWQLVDKLNAGDAAQCRRPGWIWLGCIVFGIAVWTGVEFGIHALVGLL